MNLPEEITAVIGAQSGAAEEIGRSAATVVMYPEHVLKVSPVSGFSAREADALGWLQTTGLPVPHIAAHTVTGGREWLLMTRVQGRMLCAPSVISRPALLLDCLAEGLHMLWDTDIAACPFGRTWSQELDRAERTIRAGLFDPSDCAPETFGPGGFRDPASLLDWLRKNTPPEERVLSHGDCCLPNLFTDGQHLSGMIDLGDCGVADPWRDLSKAWWSLKHNSDGSFGHTYPDIDPDDLFRAVGVPKDEDRLRLFLLLDELF
ncbi:MAG: aminoglycoside 3'-phosphotransferase [Clostridia bacterium]|nr:aminoglycoside 3'-phosphotransferase [Clostridia bacterium]